MSQVKWTSIKSIIIYTIDSFFTFSVINTVVIVTWRHTFALFDVILQNEEPVISDTTWAVSGLIACTCMFIGEPYFAEVVTHTHTHTHTHTQLVDAPTQAHVQSCTVEVQLLSRADSLTQASILPR